VRKLVVFQLHTRYDVVEMDVVIWVALEPRHQDFANGYGQVLSPIMGHVHCEAECVCGVREDMYLLYTLQINIVGLMDAVCNCLQFGVIRHSKTSHRLVVIEVPLMPEAEGRN
jgi:hypothetical protein